MIGRTLDGKYRIDRLLGQGGMGAVYEAEEVATGQRVAVKVITRSLTGDDAEALIQRFEREARAAGSIDTEHIARCLGAGTDAESGCPFMVLEYLVGEDLQQMLRRLGPLAPDLALRIVAQACQGLAKAHEARVVHRDIKPANIFLAQRSDGTRSVKILDFGVAKIRRDPEDDRGETAGLTRTGSILGSPLYMSPEQARSVKNVDQRSDIWSMGVVLYQCLAGRTPYHHLSGLGDLIIALCSDLPPPVQQFAPWITPEVAKILDFTLRIDPNERYQSAAEMLAALLPHLPDGVAVTEAMLVPLDDETHEHVAPAYIRGYSSTSPEEGRRSVTVSASAPPAAAPRPASELSGSTAGVALAGDSGHPPAQVATAATGPGLPADEGRRAPSPNPRAGPLSTVLIALGCVIAGGAGVYAVTRPGPPAAGASPSGRLSATPAEVVSTPTAPATPQTPATGASAAPSALVTVAETAGPPAQPVVTSSASASAAPSPAPLTGSAAPSLASGKSAGSAAPRQAPAPRPAASASAGGKGIDLSHGSFGDRQ